MDEVENIFKSDELDPGSFATLEKGISYTLIACTAIPVLLIPFFFVILRRGIYKLTFFMLMFLSILVFIVHFKFSWIVLLNSHLVQLYNRFQNARIRV